MINKRVNLLILIAVLQTIVFFFLPKPFELEKAMESIRYIFNNGGIIYLQPKAERTDPMYLFARELDRDIPVGAKVLYVNDATDGTDLDKYFKISYWMDNYHQNFFDLTPMPSAETILGLARRYGAEYVATYTQKIPSRELSIGDTANHRGKLYKITSDGLMVIEKYD